MAFKVGNNTGTKRKKEIRIHIPRMLRAPFLIIV